MKKQKKSIRIPLYSALPKLLDWCIFGIVLIIKLISLKGEFSSYNYLWWKLGHDVEAQIYSLFVKCVVTSTVAIILLSIFLNILFRNKRTVLLFMLFFYLLSVPTVVAIWYLLTGQTAGVGPDIWCLIAVTSYRIRYVKNCVIPTMNGIVCPHCKSIVDKKRDYCNFCGYKLPPQNENSNEKKNNQPLILGKSLDSFVDLRNNFLEIYKGTDAKTLHLVNVECSAFFAFIHYLTTKEDEYSPIEIDQYRSSLNIADSDIDLFSSRISDYLEISLNGKTLPFLNDFCLTLDDHTATIIKNFPYKDYVYAFSIFNEISYSTGSYINFENIASQPLNNYKYYFSEQFHRSFFNAIEILKISSKS